jgi:DnaK suppressor protein
MRARIYGPGVPGWQIGPDTLRRLTDTARRGVADTAQALRRMSEGNYGSCEGCGGEIPVARLEVLPWARYCAPCQQRR